MTKVLVYVEGQTEERFVRTVLASHFEQRGIFLIPKILTTKIVKTGPDFKGGLSPGCYGRTVNRELRNLLRDSSAAAVTTMFDYYGLPDDFPGRASPQGKDCFERVRFVEEQFGLDMGSERFIPYCQLHEFESLLFSEPAEIPRAFPDGPDQTSALIQIAATFRSPEEIDDNPSTHPSARLDALYRRYRKPLHGSLIAGQIGLERMRKKCHHFNEWLTKLEGLAQ
ncbi:MAG: DUF4276 family protein [Candidatus Coatesbacteria bacterium]|nr:DUF4276 family protein [Candidatus Coatesbacteria bacterium]